LHFLAFAQAGKAVADGALSHRLQPQTLHRFAGFGVLGDVIEDQFAFAPRVTGVDQAINILALDQLGQHLEPGLSFLDGGQREVGRNDGEVGKRPFAALDLEFFGATQFQQMTDGGRDDMRLAFEVVVVLGETAQRLGNIGGDGGFFGNDQLFAHRFGLLGAGA
jgi:hypothetical protein